MVSLGLQRALSRLSGARGPWCLRDSGGGCCFGVHHSPRATAELSRAAIPGTEAPGDARSLGLGCLPSQTIDRVAESANLSRHDTMIAGSSAGSLARKYCSQNRV